MPQSGCRRESIDGAARKLLGTPKSLQLINGGTDVFGDGSVILVSTAGRTPGHQSLPVHLPGSLP